MKKIAIGGDHAGFEFKQLIIEHLTALGFDVKDFGTYSSDSTDYPDYAHPVSLAVKKGEFEKGILICGSGNGVAMTANKHDGIRAAICWNTELSKLARQHNDANILCLPARFISIHLGRNIVDEFINTSFDGGRHQRRIQKMSC
jgi:ribose 5-phosphate isomerase B